MILEPIEELQKFNLLKDFSDVQLTYIRENGKQLDIPPKKVLLKQGATHTNIFLLLKGDLRLIAVDGKTSTISADSPSGKNPIAQLRPSRYQVLSATDVTLIVFPEEILQAAIEIEEAETIEVAAAQEPHEDFDSALFDILSLLHTDQLILPSLPDIAIKIRHAMEDEDSGADEISKIIQMDQSIVAKIIKTANSALYGGSKKVEDCKSAYIRLGAKKLVNLVLSYTMKELFKSDSKIIQAHMKSLWDHSVRVAAISSILARLTPGFDPEKALLAGLLHNIGAVVVLNNLGNHPAVTEDPEILQTVLLSLQAEVGSTLLKKWDFPDEITVVVEHASDWGRNHDEKGDLTDIINVAQLHSYIGTPMQENVPPLDKVPAFHKLALGQLTPEMSLQILEKSKEDIDQTIKLFQ